MSAQLTADFAKNGLTLLEITLSSEPSDWESVWIDIDVPEIDVTPGETWNIVCSNTNEDWGIRRSVGRDNPYIHSTFYLSDDDGATGDEVPDRYNGDTCFITYGYPFLV